MHKFYLLSRALHNGGIYILHWTEQIGLSLLILSAAVWINSVDALPGRLRQSEDNSIIQVNQKSFGSAINPPLRKSIINDSDLNYSDEGSNDQTFVNRRVYCFGQSGSINQRWANIPYRDWSIQCWSRTKFKGWWLPLRRILRSRRRISRVCYLILYYFLPFYAV